MPQLYPKSACFKKDMEVIFPIYDERFSIFFRRIPKLFRKHEQSFREPGRRKSACECKRFLNEIDPRRGGVSFRAVMGGSGKFLLRGRGALQKMQKTLPQILVNTFCAGAGLCGRQVFADQSPSRYASSFVGCTVPKGCWGGA